MGAEVIPLNLGKEKAIQRNSVSICPAPPSELFKQFTQLVHTTEQLYQYSHARQKQANGDGREGWTVDLEFGTVHTYYGNRYSFVFPSPDCNRSHKEEKAQVETNVYADQPKAHSWNKKMWNIRKKGKNGWNHSK